MMVDAAASATCSRTNSNTNFFFQDSARTTVYYRGTSAAFVTDGMTLTFANHTPQTNGHIEAICTFFGGDDLTVGIGTHAVATTSATQNSFTGFNFQPDAIFFASTVTALNTGVTDDFRISFGAATRLPLSNLLQVIIQKVPLLLWIWQLGLQTIQLFTITPTLQFLMQTGHLIALILLDIQSLRMQQLVLVQLTL